MAIAITISLIMIVAALNIVASLVLLVMEKSRDIAILKTMGASARSIMVIFMLQGVLIGAAGTTAGAVLGRTIAFVLDRYKLIQISTEVYQITYMPFRIETARLPAGARRGDGRSASSRRSIPRVRRRGSTRRKRCATHRAPALTRCARLHRLHVIS